MVFTKNSTFKEIMAFTGMEKTLALFFPSTFIDMVPATMGEIPLYVLQEKIRMPWGAPYPSDELLEAANLCADFIVGGVYTMVDLWKGTESDCLRDWDTSVKAWMVAPKRTEGQPRPAVICCPGGAYEMVAMMTEGIGMAQRMTQEGYCAFILSYRVKPDYYPAPQEDLIMAIKYVRKNAEKYNLDPENLMLMGSSAGGHLVGSVAELYKELEPEAMKVLAEKNTGLYNAYKGISVRPDKLCMNYPAISFMNDKVCFDNLSGGREALRDKLSLERHVSGDFPKTYIWVCEDDPLIPCETVRQMAQALKEQGVDHKAHIYPEGGHGCGLAEGTSAQGWMGEMLDFMK